MGTESHRVFSAALWSGIERVGQQVLFISVQLVLARMLGPGEIARMALLMVFIQLSQALVDGGLGQALIRKTSLEDDDSHSAFCINVVAGILLWQLLDYCSGPLAIFFSDPVLAPTMQAMAVVPVVTALGSVHQSLFVRQANFKRILLATIPSTMAAGWLGISMASNGYGVWSLVAFVMTQRMVWVVLLWILSSWRPKPRFSKTSAAELYHFGWKISAESILGVLFAHVHVLVIGKTFDAVSLGLYSNARKLQQMVTTNLILIVSRVSFASLAKSTSDLPELLHRFRRIFRVLSLVNGLICALMIATAPALFATLLGEEWMPSVPYLQGFGLIALVTPWGGLALSSINAMGRSDLTLKIGVIRKVLILLGLAVSLPYGISAVIVAQIVVSVLCYGINVACFARLVSYSFVDHLRDVQPGLLVAGLACAVMFAISALPLPSIWILLLQGVAGCGVWALVCWTLRIASYMELVEQIRAKIAPNG